MGKDENSIRRIKNKLSELSISDLKAMIDFADYNRRHGDFATWTDVWTMASNRLKEKIAYMFEFDEV